MSSWRDRLRESSPLEIPDEPASLCETCRSVHHKLLRDDGWEWEVVNDYVRRNHHHATGVEKLYTDEWPDLPRLHNSVRQGCDFCTLLQGAFNSTRFQDAFERLAEGATAKLDQNQLRIELRYLGDKETRSPNDGHPPPTRGLRNLIVICTFETGLMVYLRFELEENPDDPEVGKWLRLGPPATRNHEDTGTTLFLKAQLQKCTTSLDNNHCSGVFIPARLIDVNAGRLRLVTREDVMASSSGQPEYCALSYCWGPSKDAKGQITAKNGNLDNHLRGLEFNTLTPVLKDAVKTARSLDIPYLWVDSLCILQDDMKDWQHQCTQMNEIYGKARVTLIAACSRTCQEGFLNPKENIQGWRFPYQSARRPSISGSLMMYLTHVFGDAEWSMDSALFNDLHNDLTFSRWARRGWTFQEEAMAGARIVFGTSGVYFGLHNKYVSKDGAAGSVEQLEAVTSLQSNDELHGAWNNILHRYSAFSKSAFTNPRDLLPALSGLARNFARGLQVESVPRPWKYIAGHWVEMLHLTLLWTEDSETARPSLNDITRRYSQKPYLIPSWSCLTRGCVVSLVNDASGYRSKIRILDVHMSLVAEDPDLDPYGAIKNAHLTLEGFILDLASLSWSESPDELVGSLGSHENIEFYDNLRAFLPPRRYPIIFNFCNHGDRYEHFKYELILDFQMVPGSGSQLGKIGRLFDQLISRATLLLVGTRDSYEGNVLKNRVAYGLVLVPLEGESARSFLRVGAFRSNYGHGGDVLPCLERLMKREVIKIF